MTEKGAKRYNTSVLRGLIWSTPALFHRVIHSICGIALPAEFAAGTDPTQTNSLVRLVRPVILPGGGLHLEWPSVQGHAYLVEGSQDGRNWTPVSGWIPALTTLTTFTPATGAGAPFLFRLQVRP